MTSEYVQRLAEWLEKKAPQVWAQFSAKATAQEALDASGATARIEELEGDVKFQIENLRGWIDLNADLLKRALKAEKRVEELEKALDRAEDEGCICGRMGVRQTHLLQCAFWPVNGLRAALSQAQQSEPS